MLCLPLPWLRTVIRGRTEPYLQPRAILYGPAQAAKCGPIVDRGLALRSPGRLARKGRTMDGYVLRDSPGWTWKANGRDNQGRFDFLVVDHVAYGTGPPLHVHATQEDSFYVLKGVLTVQVADDVIELGPGDFATAPPGVPHSFTNAHAEQTSCRTVNLLTPGIGFDSYLSQIEQVAATGDHEAIDRLNAKYGVTLVGPSLAERLGLS